MTLLREKDRVVLLIVVVFLTPPKLSICGHSFKLANPLSILIQLNASSNVMYVMV